MAKSICNGCKRLYPYAVSYCYCGCKSMSIDFTEESSRVNKLIDKLLQQTVIEDFTCDVIECKGTLVDKKG